jgi:hypothetical protein
MTPDKGPNCGEYPIAGSGSEGSDGVSDLFAGGTIGGAKSGVGRYCELTVGDMVGAAATMKSSTTNVYLSTVLSDNRSKPRVATS